MTNPATNMFVYLGRSMWPYFQEGDLLEFQPCPVQDIKTGDCVVFTSNGRNVTHRVISTGASLSTRGDAHCERDKEVVDANRFLGKVVRRYRHGAPLTVIGGIAGSIAGKFYYYAGRIDPSRNTRGGQIARIIRAFSMTLLKPVWARGRCSQFVISEDETVTFWTIGNQVFGRKYNKGQEWHIPWPLCNLIIIREN